MSNCARSAALTMLLAVSGLPWAVPVSARSGNTGTDARSSVPAPPAPGSTATGGTSASSGAGLWVTDSAGIVQNVGAAPDLGDVGGAALNAPIVAMAATADAGGYWLLGRDGGVFSYGNAVFRGSTGNLKLNQPVVSLASDPKGRGYWFVAGDGGIFAFGAPFKGSSANLRLNQPIVGMASTKSGEGYWLIARDGGIFAYGDAAFAGSTGAIKLNQPIVGMAADPDGAGYWFVAGDGGVFSFNATFHGSAVGSLQPGDMVTAMAAHPAGGYWLITAKGGVLAYGAATTTTSAQPPSLGATAKLNALRVAGPETSTYDRDSWPHWIDADNDCQDTRNEVLIAESTVTVTLTANRCDVIAGRWIDVYTGAVFTDPSLLDIDHMVPLANAHRSGGAGFDRGRKTAYANYLGIDDALIAVSASANRSKGDKSPDQWLPSNAASHCRYATAWVDVKYEWTLTMTTTEKTTLTQLLSDC